MALASPLMAGESPSTPLPLPRAAPVSIVVTARAAIVHLLTGRMRGIHFLCEPVPGTRLGQSIAFHQVAECPSKVFFVKSVWVQGHCHTQILLHCSDC